MPDKKFKKKERLSIPKIEETVLKFWKRNRIFEKSLELRKDSPRYVFFEGPPTANGLPGIHHVETRVFKDAIGRYKTMAGFLVERKAGWDTHGLPVELEVEKELGLKSKRDIEKYGIALFNQKCRESVWRYKAEWESLTERIGFWLDMKNPYITYENDYIETLWWIIKNIWDQGLLYQDYKVAPYCWRCGTVLSSHEVAQGYELVKENSIYVKFRIKSSFAKATEGKLKSNFSKNYFLVWTTTPWTLAANLALAVNPNFTYVKVENKGEKLILAKDRLSVLNGSYKLVEEIEGKDLKGLEYEPLFNFVKLDKKTHFVVAADFVTVQEGTGIVHIAPGFGEEDMEVGKANDLPVLVTLDDSGNFIDQVKPWAGLNFKEADPKIIEDLKSRNLLYKEEIYEHDYPFCWRCVQPLIYMARTSWFVKMTALKNELLENAEKINWIPDHLKEGRFGEWLEELKDWAFSRERYWGTPLPIWQCQSCNYFKIIGSFHELKDFSITKVDWRRFDPHRPLVDKIEFHCDKCEGIMKRVKEVVDVWFDSGAMPYGQWHYPFTNKDKIDRSFNFPADYIVEGIDQTRGWFYTLLAVSTLLHKGYPYRNVISMGHVLDEKGQKMSKSKGNVVDPWEVIRKYGSDTIRWYFYTVNPPGEPKLFSLKDVEERFNGFISKLYNILDFFRTYVDIDKAKFFTHPKPIHILDNWLFTYFNRLKHQVILNLDSLDAVSAARTLNIFVEDLSNWYLRRSREKFQKPANAKAFLYAASFLRYILLELAKVLAPFVPLAAEEIHLAMHRNRKPATLSVHWHDFPAVLKEDIDLKLEEDMKLTREIAGLGLAARIKKAIKVRQPLAELRYKGPMLGQEFLDLIKDEVNVKKVSRLEKLPDQDNWVRVREKDLEVAINSEITASLREEGLARDIIRHIQDLRKAAGYKIDQKPTLFWSTDSKDLKELFTRWQSSFKEETKLWKIFAKPEGKIVTDAQDHFEHEGSILWLALKLKRIVK